MAFQKAVKQAKYSKISVQGKEKSGKTTTAAELAIYLAQKHHTGKPVAFLASEPGIDFVIEFFEKEGVELLAERSRAFITLKNAIPEAVKAGAGVLLIDSATAFWQEAVKAYKTAKNISRKLKPFEYTPIKEKWREFTDQFVDAKLDIIVCGRLGFEYEDLEDEDGNKEMTRSDTKMKTEGDFNYETDLIIEMTSRPDPGAGNAINVGEGSKKKLRRSFKASNIHIATVKGCRVWALNQQVFEFKAKAAYQVGDAAKVGACFDPYFNFLKLKGGDGNVVDKHDSTSEFSAAEDGRAYAAKSLRRDKAFENIKGALSCVFTAATGKDAAFKLEIINSIFGTHSWTEVERMEPEALEHGARVSLRVKDFCVSNQPQNRDSLLVAVEQAKAEIRDESFNPIKPVQEQSAVNEASVPF